jgi:ribosomal-protein-alanine N-acetyltransferase
MASRPEQIYLRRPRESDFDELKRRFDTSKAHLRGVAATNFDRQRFDTLLSTAKTESIESFLICLTETDEIVGQITLSQIFRKGFQNAYLGYRLFNGFTGNGYMTQAVNVVLRFAFEQLGLHRVEANVQPDNRPSIAVLERTGFVKEGFSRRYLKIGGRWRDHERWAIIKEDWLAKRIR